jgi:hypothetical protein
MPKRQPNFSLADVMTGVVLLLFLAFAVLVGLGWINFGLHD